MPTGDCFRCRKPGHWLKDCPLNIAPKNDSATCAENTISDSPLAFLCDCRAGFCLVKISRTQKNPNRKFYKCPGVNDCGFFKWCDQVTVEETKISPVPVHPIPICPCGSGPCRKQKVKEGPNAGRSYFVCCIKENFGACGFFRWEDEEVNSTISQQGTENTGSCSSQPWSRDPLLETRAERDLSTELVSCDADLTIQRFKSMGAENTSGFESRVREVPILCHEDKELPNQNGIAGETSNVSTSNLKKELLVSDSLAGDMISDESDSHSLHSPIGNSLQIYSPVPVFNILWQDDMRRQISASSDDVTRGILPSSDPTNAPPEMAQLQTEEQLLLPHTVRDAKPEAALVCLQPDDQPQRTNSNTPEPDEVDSLPSSLVLSESDEHFAETVHSTASEDSDTLHNSRSLQSSDCYDPEPPFRSRPSLLDLVGEYNTERVYFNGISERHEEALAAFLSSYQQLTSLCKEASHLRKLLLGVEEQISCCKAETSERFASYRAVSKELSGSQRRMLAVSEKLERSDIFSQCDLHTG